MTQAFEIEIIVNTEKELDEVDIQNILEDVINFEGLDWEVTRCYEDIFGRLPDTPLATTSLGSTETVIRRG